MAQDKWEELVSLEDQVCEIWGNDLWGWTLGRSPEGWFYYCGNMQSPTLKSQWKHGGHEPTLHGALIRMILLKDAPSNRLTPEARALLELDNE